MLIIALRGEGSRPTISTLAWGNLQLRYKSDFAT
jgi:hypothetical protein